MEKSEDTDIELTLTNLVYGGEAMGRLPDGKAVFVPFALPGEKVLIHLTTEKRGYARGELVEILEKSPLRVEPVCPYFGKCGGCHYQHLTYAESLVAKQNILKEQLERIGGLSNPPVEQTVPSPEPLQYRNIVQFHLTPEGALGFYKQNTKDILPVEKCFLPKEALDPIWHQLDFGEDTAIERVGLRLGMEDEIQLILESSELEAPALTVEDLPISVVHLSPAGSLLLAGNPFIFMEVSAHTFRVSAASFFQINTKMAEKLVAHLLKTASQYQPLTRKTTLLDVYCGVGLFSAFFAPLVGKVIGVESSPSACDDYAYNLDDFDNVELYEAPAEIALPAIAETPDIIILDPPRGGIARQAMDGLLKLSPPLILYVSCDPSTLARDAKKLIAGGYRLESVTPFDMFPQTYHIESVSVWRKQK